MKQIFTTKTAADRLGISGARVRRLILDGRIKAEKIGRDHVIKKRDLERFEATRKGANNG